MRSRSRFRSLSRSGGRSSVVILGLFFGGVAMMVGGVLAAQEHPAAGLALAGTGFAVAVTPFFLAPAGGAAPGATDVPDGGPAGNDGARRG